MLTLNKKYVVAAVKTHAGDPLVDAAKRSVENDALSPSKLRTELKAAGYVVDDDPKNHEKLKFRTFENASRVLIMKGSDVVAMGACQAHENAADLALTHAVLGYVRERDIELFGEVKPDVFHKTVHPTQIKEAKARAATPKAGK
jgi:hypothetical protein